MLANAQDLKQLHCHSKSTKGMMQAGWFISRRPACARCATNLGSISIRRQSSHSKIGLFRKGSLRERSAEKTPARTRFAPSPTGYLHLGSLRTALFNFLLARSTGGQFLLRLEDTDQTRLVPDAERRLYEDLKWAGLSWDEGPDVGGPYGPYRQSERLESYKTHADTLIKEGKAYRCFCSPLDLQRHQEQAHASGDSTKYPGTCRHISPDESEGRQHESHAVRFKSSQTPVEIRDLVYSRYKKAETEEDYVIIKRDGFPTYHFANVVDDHLMKITHVIRGAEWLISTPKHVDLYQAFGWTPPQFAHLGLLVNQDGQKLSKRHGGFDIEDYKRDNILPSALINFVALHGWRRRGINSDVLTLDAMIEKFDLACSKGDITVTFEKLPFLDAKHRKILIDQDPPNMVLLSEIWLKPVMESIRRLNDAIGHSANLQAANPASHHSIETNVDASGTMVRNFMHDTPSLEPYILKAMRISSKLPDPKASVDSWVMDNKHLFWNATSHTLEEKLDAIPFDQCFIGAQPSAVADVIRHFLDAANDVSKDEWNLGAIQSVFVDTIKGVSFRNRTTGEMTRAGGSILLRWALLGGDHGPALIPIMELLGKEVTVRRLNLALDVAQEQHESLAARVGKSA